MKKMLIVSLVLAMVLMTVPALAKGPKLNGNAEVLSGVGGSIISGQYGNGGSFAMVNANNTTWAGFSTAKEGNTITATTFGGSIGATFGFAINGLVQGFQGGAFSANAWMTIP